MRLALYAEVLRVLAALPRVEAGRRLLGPRPLVERLRRRVTRRPARELAARERLRLAIRWVDARLPGGESCYRRALLETALDRAAAAEPLWLGLEADDRPGSGHAWLGDARGRPEPYAVEVRL